MHMRSNRACPNSVRRGTFFSTIPPQWSAVLWRPHFPSLDLAFIRTIVVGLAALVLRRYARTERSNQRRSQQLNSFHAFVYRRFILYHVHPAQLRKTKASKSNPFPSLIATPCTPFRSAFTLPAGTLTFCQCSHFLTSSPSFRTSMGEPAHAPPCL